MRLKDLRIKAGLTQIQVAKAIGVCVATYRRYETAGILNVRITKVIALAKFYKVSCNYLLGLN